MTLILIKKEDFYFKNKIGSGNWSLNPLEGARFESSKVAQNYIERHLKDCKDCKVVTVDVEFKERKD